MTAVPTNAARDAAAGAFLICGFCGTKSHSIGPGPSYAHDTHRCAERLASHHAHMLVALQRAERLIDGMIVAKLMSREDFADDRAQIRAAIERASKP